MRQATPELREQARRLFTQGGGRGSRPDPAGVMEAACRELQRRFNPLIGSAGFASLLRRGLNIAGRDFPWLDADGVEPSADCSLNGLAEAARGRDEAEAREAFAFVLANVVWLLVTFIGEDITGGLLRETWPWDGTGEATQTPGEER